MNENIFLFLSGLPLFSCLSRKELAAVAESVQVAQYSNRHLLARQSRTFLDCFYIVYDGSIELFYLRKGQKEHRSVLKRGDNLGAVSILMNGGISLFTARISGQTTVYEIPRKVFLKICIQHKPFYEYFEKNHAGELQNPFYAKIIETCAAFRFLKTVAAFSLLPEEEIESVAWELASVSYPRGSILFVQDQTLVEYLYIIRKGAAERYFEQNDRKIRGGLSGEGTVYGGISILFNDGIAVRTLRLNEDSRFYVLPKQLFLKLCQEHQSFAGYFTDTLGSRMLDKSYAELLSKSIEPKNEAIQVFNQPVSKLFHRDPQFCDLDLTVREAASIMKRHGVSFLLVREKNGDFIGILTEKDLVSKVVAEGRHPDRAVKEIMSRPVITISDQSLFHEAHLKMMHKNIAHLAVTDPSNKIVGAIAHQDLLNAYMQSPSFAVFEIGTAKSLKEIFDKHRQLPKIVGSLMESGATVKNITRYITTFSDTILHKLMEFALEKTGPPPVKFVFMIMGSEGRREQTLKTDQDNAIIFENVEEEKLEETKKYFLKLSEAVCDWLDKSGYSFCRGNIMAKNPKWCQPMRVWKQYFSEWIFTAESEALLDASIFFDFRGAYGDQELIDELRKFLSDSLLGWPGFFRHLTENALHYKPPLGFFGNIVVQSRGEHRNTFDIKNAMMPIIDFARIYALKHGLEATNTQERLLELHMRKILEWGEYNELEQAYGFLMQIRFKHQVNKLIREGVSPDNNVNLKSLSRIEQTMLKEVFKRIDKFQTKLNIDFTGLV